MTPIEAGKHRWLCQIYNGRGQLTEAQWLKFAKFCEEHGFMDEPNPGVRIDGVNTWDAFELNLRGLPC